MKRLRGEEMKGRRDETTTGRRDEGTEQTKETNVIKYDRGLKNG
jgi:hypothetical protein